MSTEPPTPRLDGHGVVLEPLAFDHVPGLISAASEADELFGYNPIPRGATGIERHVTNAVAEAVAGIRMPFAIWWSERLVGTTSFFELQPWKWPEGSPNQRTDRPDAVEIGATWLAPSAQGTTCNVASKLVMLNHAFDEWEVCRVAFRTDTRNVRSRRAVELLGASFEGIRRNHLPGLDGTCRDTAYYSIIDSEWPDVRHKLLHRLELRQRIAGEGPSTS